MEAPDPLKDITDLAHDFTGREWVFKAIDNWLANPTGSRVFLLTGGPGSGKSAISARLAQMNRREVSANGYACLSPGFLTFYQFCRAFNDPSLDPLGFVKSLSVTLANRYTPFQEALLRAERHDSRVSVQQTVSTAAQGSQVIAIQNLYINLSSRAAFGRVVREPLEYLYSTGFDGTVLVLVDGLDEALTYDPEQNIVTLLGDVTDSPRDLPPGVRFLLTSRGEDQRVAELVGESALDLIDDAPEDVDDVKAYAFHRLRTLPEPKRRKLADRIAQMGKGNFLYARYVLDDPGEEIAQIDDVDRLPLPKDLDEVYGRFLKRELARTSSTWDNYSPMLGILAVARGSGLTRQQLKTIVKHRASRLEKPFRDSDLDARLRPCMQYLAGARPDGPFHIYHQSFREFLVTNAGYPTYPAEANSDIADYYWQTYRKDWLGCDDYGLSNLAIHLVQAENSACLEQLIGQGWMNARVQEGDYSGFLLDVDAAWQAALNKSVFDENTFLRIFRYALIRTSVNSLSLSCPPALVVRAWELGLWSSGRLFSAAKILRGTPAVRLWAAVLAAGKLTSSEKVLAERLALNEAGNVQPASARVEAFTSLVAHLSDEAKLEALQEGQKAVDEIKGANERCWALTTLAGNLDPERKHRALDEVLNTLCRLEDWRGRSDTDRERAFAIANLAPLVSEDLARRALEVANTLSNGPRSWAQAALIPRLPENTRTSAVREVVNALDDARAAVRELFQFDTAGGKRQLRKKLEDLGLFRLLPLVVDYLSEDERERLLRDSLLLIDALDFPESDRYDLLLTIAPVLSSNLALQAVVIARGISSVGACGEILAYLASRLPPEAAKTLLRETQNAWIEAPAIDRFVAATAWAATGPPESKAELLRTALASAEQVVAAVWDIERLVKIVTRLELLVPGLDDDLVEAALQLVLNPKLEPMSNKLLERIAPRLSGALLQRAFAAQVRIEDEAARVLAMSTIGSHLTGPAREVTLEYALDTAIQIVHLYPRVKVLARLAPLLRAEAKGRALTEGLKVVKNAYPFPDLALGFLAPSLTEQLTEVGLQTALQLNNSRGEQAYGLAAVAAKLSGDKKQELVRDVLSRIASLEGSFGRARALVQLAPSLEGPSVEAALIEARRLRGRERLDALLAIAVHLSGDAKGELIRECWEGAKSLLIREKVEVLLALNPLLDDGLPQEAVGDVLDSIKMIKEPDLRVEMLAKAVPLLSSAQRDPAIRECLESLSGLDDFHKADVLKSLSLHLSEELCERAMESTEAIADVKERARALSALIVRWAADCKGVEEQVALLSRIGAWLYSMRELRREDLLFFCTRSVFEQSLLSENSLEETARAVQEIAEEWVFPP